MNILIKIIGIEINMQTFLAFFIGMGLGFLLLLLLYLYAVLRNLNKRFVSQKVQEEDIDEEEIKWLIEDAQEQFKDKKLRAEVGFGKHLFHISRDLSHDISKKFYPESNYPYLEITIDEAIALSHYITNRLDELLDSSILRLFRGMTIRRIVELNETKEKIEDTKIVKGAKKYKLGAITSATLKAINIVNPFYWFRKLTVNKAIDVVVIRISLSLIAITGEETYKIYSKKVFDVEKNIETSVDDLYEELKRDMEGAAHDEEEE